jgi:hypothetical protein
MSDSDKVGSPPGGPGSIAAADRVPGAGAKGIASGGLSETGPAGSRLAGKGAPIVPGSGTGEANLQPDLADSTGMSGNVTNESLPHGGATDDPAPTPNAKPGAGPGPGSGAR